MKNAVPCGLILNELISNVYKHAFTNQDKGEVIIQCAKTNDKFMLTFIDNGKGFDSVEVMRNITSLGLTLVNALVEQINGTLHVENNNGTKYIISFTE
jgi:two-component sensor histidine kinase